MAMKNHLGDFYAGWYIIIKLFEVVTLTFMWKTPLTGEKSGGESSLKELQSSQGKMAAGTRKKVMKMVSTDRFMSY